MHSLYDGENIYRRCENVIFMERLKIVKPSFARVAKVKLDCFMRCNTFLLEFMGTVVNIIIVL